jgi:sugar phosphate isomerase/epimerase
MKTSFHTGFLTDLPVLEAVTLVSAHGYDFVELNAESLPWQKPHVTPETTLAERRALASAASYSAISAHHADVGHPDDALREGAVAWTTALVDLAVDLSCPVVHLIPGANAELEPLYDSFARVVEHGQARGVTIALEPIVEQVIGTSTQALTALERVPGLTINFDPSHLQVMEHDIPGAALRLGRYTVHAALKDAAGHPGNWTFPALGDGEVPFDRMLAVLRAEGFDGVVSVEHESHVFAGDERGHEQVLAESKAFLDALRETADTRR